MTGCAESGRVEGVGEGPQQCMAIYTDLSYIHTFIVQELCESRGGRPGLSVLTSLLVSVE